MSAKVPSTTRRSPITVNVVTLSMGPLRGLQADLLPGIAESSRDAFLTSVGTESVLVSRIDAYTRATLLRLVGVHAFRSRWRHVAEVFLRR